MPRRLLAAGRSVGDCVDCNACVAVCPMGIDIRDGQQLECITCALCIDACDGVMDKIGKERGLISYATLNDYNANMALATGRRHASRRSGAGARMRGGRLVDGLAHFHLRKIFRPRTFVYFAIWSAIGLGLLYALLSRDRLEINVLHDRNPQFVTLSDGSIRNGYTVKLLNMIPEPRTFMLSIEGLPAARRCRSSASTSRKTRSFAVPVEPDRLQMLKVFVRLPRDERRRRARHLHLRRQGPDEFRGRPLHRHLQRAGEDRNEDDRRTQAASSPAATCCRSCSPSSA